MGQLVGQLEPQSMRREWPFGLFWEVLAHDVDAVLGRYPRGFKYPNKQIIGLNYYTYSGCWGLIPSYLGTWTFQACLVPVVKACGGLHRVLTTRSTADFKNGESFKGA